MDRRDAGQILENLAETSSVMAAVRMTGVSRAHVYRLRNADTDFDNAWLETLDGADDAIIEEARRRPLEPSEEPVLHRGKPVLNADGSMPAIRRYDDRMLLALLNKIRMI